MGGPYEPRLQEGHNAGVVNNIRCAGGLNITNPATFDPTTNILYVSHSRGCSGGGLQPGAEGGRARRDVDHGDDALAVGQRHRARR